MGLTKAELEALNDSSFPNNNGGLITPQILRDYNDATIANTVNQDDYTADSASFNSRILAATGSVTSAVTGSSLITASFDNGTRNLTFTKGNNTTFAVNIPDVSGSGTINTGSLVTTASFNAYTQSNDQRVSSLESTTASLLVETQNLELFSASALTSLSNLNTATSSLFTSASLSLTTASFSGNTLTFRKGDGTTFGIVIPDVSGSGGAISVQDEGSILGNATSFNFTGAGVTATLSAGTASITIPGGGGSIDTGSFATTGSNVFTGDQTFIDNGSNFFTITDASGSMVLVGKSMTSSSLHISQSAATAGAGAVNLIFKTNNNTADTIISGSNNIFQNPAAPTAGFKRYLTSNNIALGAGFPNLSGSVQFSPSVSNNYFGGTLNMRLPVSASSFSVATNSLLGTLNVGQTAILNAEKLTGVSSVATNFIAGTVNLIANQSDIRGTTNITNNNINGTAQLNLGSSATLFSNNSINDSSFIFNNQFTSGGIGFGQSQIIGNTIGGNGNIFIATGSQAVASTQPAAISNNIVIGNSNTIFVNSTDSRVSGTTIYHQAAGTGLIGNRLNVTGSSNFIGDTNSFGSAFVGRWNASDGVRDRTSDIVFAVGTGTSTARKTGFLVDSGSNTFVEGTLNVSGSTTMTGSLIISSSNAVELFVIGDSQFTGSIAATGTFTASLAQGFTYVGDASGRTTLVATSSFGGGSAIATGSFATTGSNAFFGNQIISGNIGIRGNTTFTSVSGDQSSVILGSSALANSVGGNINVAIGNSAMQNASGSTQNVAIGNRALFKSTGSFNIAIGSETMTENTTGTNNVAIGLNALNLNTTAGDNFAMGSNSMQFTSGSSANSNVAIGTDTLTRNQVDSQIAIGANALQRATTGNANTAIGRLALQNTTTGFDNVAIGTNTLLSNITGQRNIAIGKESLRNAAPSSLYNVGIGYSTLYNAKSNNNVAIGHAVLENLQSGSDNVAIGYSTGYDITTGFYNTLIGGNLRGQSDWNSVIAISNGLGDAGIKFFNSGSRTTITNDTLISGSLTTTGSLTIQSGSSFFANGNKQFNIGAFQSDITQSGSANVSQSMNFEVTDISEGVTIASNSRITLANSGTYNIQFSAQIDRVSGSGIDEVHIWLKKNGTNVSASAGVVTLSGGAAAAKTIAAWNYVVNAAANDYYELCWESTDANIQLINQAAGGNIPSTPSIILTVTQVR